MSGNQDAIFPVFARQVNRFQIGGANSLENESLNLYAARFDPKVIDLPK